MHKICAQEIFLKLQEDSWKTFLFLNIESELVGLKNCVQRGEKVHITKIFLEKWKKKSNWNNCRWWMLWRMLYPLIWTPDQDKTSESNWHTRILQTLLGWFLTKSNVLDISFEKQCHVLLNYLFALCYMTLDENWHSICSHTVTHIDRNLYPNEDIANSKTETITAILL